MSELRIALVAEGPTDKIVIEAALKAFLPNPFVLTLLHPEPNQPKMGGWGGVLKWCRAFQQTGYDSLEDDPKLGLFDLVIVHLDADVADKSYANYGHQVEEMAIENNLKILPCSQPCPPPSATVAQIRSLLLSWLGIAEVGNRTVICIPSKSTEAWLAAALLSENQDLMAGIECEMNTERILENLPKAQRVRKSQREYLAHVGAVTASWASSVRMHCTQAALFEVQILAAVQI